MSPGRMLLRAIIVAALSLAAIDLFLWYYS
jgi:hypothetical protein